MWYLFEEGWKIKKWDFAIVLIIICLCVYKVYTYVKYISMIDIQQIIHSLIITFFFNFFCNYKYWLKYS